MIVRPTSASTGTHAKPRDKSRGPKDERRLCGEGDTAGGMCGSEFSGEYSTMIRPREAAEQSIPAFVQGISKTRWNSDTENRKEGWAGSSYARVDGFPITIFVINLPLRTVLCLSVML